MQKNVKKISISNGKTTAAIEIVLLQMDFYSLCEQHPVCISMHNKFVYPNNNRKRIAKLISSRFLLFFFQSQINPQTWTFFWPMLSIELLWYWSNFSFFFLLFNIQLILDFLHMFLLCTCIIVYLGFVVFLLLLLWKKLHYMHIFQIWYLMRQNDLFVPFRRVCNEIQMVSNGFLFHVHLSDTSTGKTKSFNRGNSKIMNSGTWCVTSTEKSLSQGQNNFL